MNEDTEVIMDSGDIFEDRDPDEEVANLEVTKGATGAPGELSVHVQMKGWTLQDVTEAIIIAAADQILKSREIGEAVLRRRVEEKVLDVFNDRINDIVEKVADDALSRPLTKPPFSSGKDPNEAVTIGDFLELTSTGFLNQHVDSEGKSTPKSHSRSVYGRTKPRIEHLVLNAMDHKLKKEMDAAVSKATREVQAEVRKAHEAMVEEHKAKLRDALQSAVASKA